MFKKAMFLLMFVIFMVIGCDQIIHTQINLDQLESFNPESDEIYVPGRLVFEVPSEKEFNKTRHFLEATLNDYFVNVKNVRHVKENFDDFVLVDVEVPLTHGRVNNMPTPLYFTYSDRTVYLNLSEVALLRLNDDLKKALNKGINRLTDIRITAYVLNDTHFPVTLTTPSLFIDNVSVEDGSTVDLKSGESTVLTSSNVMVDLSSKQSVKFFSF